MLPEHNNLVACLSPTHESNHSEDRPETEIMILCCNVSLLFHVKISAQTRNIIKRFLADPVNLSKSSHLSIFYNRTIFICCLQRAEIDTL